MMSMTKGILRSFVLQNASKAMGLATERACEFDQHPGLVDRNFDFAVACLSDICATQPLDDWPR